MVMKTIKKMMLSVIRNVVKPRIMPMRLPRIGYKRLMVEFSFMTFLSTSFISISSILNRRKGINKKAPESSLAL